MFTGDHAYTEFVRSGNGSDQLFFYHVPSPSNLKHITGVLLVNHFIL